MQTMPESYRLNGGCLCGKNSLTKKNRQSKALPGGLSLGCLPSVVDGDGAIGMVVAPLKESFFYPLFVVFCSNFPAGMITKFQLFWLPATVFPIGHWVETSVAVVVPEVRMPFAARKRLRYTDKINTNTAALLISFHPG
jgi:hypothetical protein